MSINPLNNYDVLVNTSMSNNLIDNKQLEYWKNSVILSTYSSLSDNDAKAKLDNVMSNTTIKRACCLGADNGDGTFAVKVKIPITPNFEDYNSLEDFNKKFQYVEQTVKVPKNLCNNLPSAHGNASYVKPNKNNSTYSSPCDDFYGLYCGNALAQYADDYARLYNTDSNPDPEIFAKLYKKECACYNFDSSVPNALSISPKCLLYPECTDVNNDIGLTYLDPMSRSDCPQTINICQQLMNFSGLHAGGNVTITPDMSNKCGQTGTVLPQTYNQTVTNQETTVYNARQNTSSNQNQSNNGTAGNTNNNNNNNQNNKKNNSSSNNNTSMNSNTSLNQLVQNYSDVATKYLESNLFGILPSWMLLLCVCILLIFCCMVCCGIFVFSANQTQSSNIM